MVSNPISGQGVGVGAAAAAGGQSTLSNFSQAATKASSKLTEMSKYLTEQEVILKKVRKQWKMLTGGIIGAFYSIAKLSPLFASYISEFGGVLGYVYDTAIIPWGDEIERLLDIMWGWSDAFDDADTGTQKWVGGLLMGVPILAGLLLSLTGLGEILVWVAGSKFVAFVVSAVAAIGALPTIVIAAIALLLVAIVKYRKQIWYHVKNLMLGFYLLALAGKRAVVAIINAFLTLPSKIGNAMRSAYNKAKEWVDKIASYVKSKMPGWVTGASSSISNTLHGVLGSNATGAHITQTGIYKLHQGEVVTPSSMSNTSNSTNIINISPQITVNGGTSSHIDIRRLADDLSKYWMSDIQKIVGSGHR